ncbi:hypothetical protein ON010_g4169 [Phytophthora cinnamomi]|nr:hypothetical protein ON010_g4169 [Phytophthora cinnamomi]
MIGQPRQSLIGQSKEQSDSQKGKCKLHFWFTILLRAMTQDRLQILDVDVSVQAPARTGAPVQLSDNQSIAVCDTNRVVAIANGRFVDLYGASNKSLHPFTFLHQISLGDHVTRSQRPSFDGQHNGDKLDRSVVVATCVAFPVPGFLLVAAFVEVPDAEISGDGDAVEPTRATFLLGFRLYAGSASQFVGVVDGSTPRQTATTVQVHFSFVEPVVGNAGRGIRCLQPCRREMTPDGGAVDVLFDHSNVVGVFNWRERFSDRQVCLARLKQQPRTLVVAERSSDGRYLLVGDAGGRLSLLDFRDFPWVGYGISSNAQQLRGKRLELGVCSRSGVIARDNPFEHVRLVHSTAGSDSSCAHTSLRWWVCGVRNEQKQFVLAGKQDGSLSVLKFIKENSDTDFNVQLKMIQIYPGLVSGTHDSIRDISVPVRSSATATNDDFFEFCTVSEMRWRTWRIKVEHAPQRYRMQWPSLKESLGFPAFALRVSAFKDFTVLPNYGEFSKLFTEALSDSAPDHITRSPIWLIVADDRLQVVGLVTKAPAVTASDSESNPSEKNDCDSSDKQRVCEEMQEEVSNVDHTERSEEEQRRSGPATLQERYKLPPMEWETRTSALGDQTSPNSPPDQGGDAPSTARTSKLSRVDYNKRVASVIQRVEALSGVMQSMRTSFQLFSNDVQQHMNLISEQLDELKASSHTGCSVRIEAEVMEKSYLQAQAEMARFGAGSGSQGGMERPNNQTPSPVIPHVVDKYDPDHPDADWGGYVRCSAKKRFYTNQSSAKDNLTYDEKGGIMPRDPADSSSTSGKKLFEPKQNSSGDQVPGIPFQSAVYQYEQGRGGRQNSARAQSPSTPWESGQGMPPPLSGSCSSGSLSGRRIDSRRSLLAGIGKLVAAEDLSGILPPERHLPESYTNPTSKTLLAEN